MTPAHLSAYFGFPLVDYMRAGDGLLVASGCGLMLAVMDAVPRFRWCVDIDQHRELWGRLGGWLAALDLNCALGLIGGVGRFMADDPSEMREALARVKRTPVCAYAGPQTPLGGALVSLAQFIDACNRPAQG